MKQVARNTTDSVDGSLGTRYLLLDRDAKFCATFRSFQIRCRKRLGGLLRYYHRAAALKIRHREAYIGWNEKTKYRRLHLIANNERFLILPWGDVEAGRELAAERSRLRVDKPPGDGEEGRRAAPGVGAGALDGRERPALGERRHVRRRPEPDPETQWAQGDASLRNTAISILRLAGDRYIAKAIRWCARHAEDCRRLIGLHETRRSMQVARIRLDSYVLALLTSRTFL